MVFLLNRREFDIGSEHQRLATKLIPYTIITSRDHAEDWLPLATPQCRLVTVFIPSLTV